MGLFDFLGYGDSGKKKPAAGPHVTRDRQELERRDRIAATDAAKAKNREVSSKLDADAKAKADAMAADNKKKKAKAFWKDVLN